VTEHSLKGASNYNNRVTGVDNKHAVLRPRVTGNRPGSLSLIFKLTVTVTEMAKLFKNYN